MCALIRWERIAVRATLNCRKTFCWVLSYNVSRLAKNVLSVKCKTTTHLLSEEVQIEDVTNANHDEISNAAKIEAVSKKPFARSQQGCSL